MNHLRGLSIKTVQAASSIGSFVKGRFYVSKARIRKHLSILSKSGTTPLPISQHVDYLRIGNRMERAWNLKRHAYVKSNQQHF